MSVSQEVEALLNLLYTEMMKMKGSKMFLVSLLGAAVAPVMVFFMLITYRDRSPGVEILFSNFYNQTHIFIALMIGSLLFGLIATYIINREYQEDTLKNLFTIPVSRTGLLISKLIVLFGWIQILMLAAFLLCLLLGVIGSFEALNISVLTNHFIQYMKTGFLLFCLTPPVLLITMLFKNYVPSIAFTIMVTVIAIIVINSDDYVSIYPWTVPFVLTMEKVPPNFSIYPSILSIALMFLASLSGCLLYLNRADIQ
ncbi:bacitracin transport system permease protein [Geosporobacter subterraneus DSM 17957]|uniref:Bacitracin transport system permease protein n=1 Tax=Geosporobacter subterraneus DSM 17957 TaxID=1121919 RepID=A0A1M6GMA3_9FIRM|nr:bacitracin transport system permease protein [Geosporobacter subterraneus DSM 17957]